MRKKLFYPLVGFVLLTFLFSFILSTPLVAQEKEEEAEDVMDMDLEDLLNVEITTAGKKAQKIADIPASVVVITRADIERYGYTSLAEILENVPGLYGIDQRDVTGEKFGVRGFWSATANSIIYLINGVRQERITSDGATYMAQSIPPEAIDRIEVIRGPMSVIYGTGAFFGAINIITNNGEEKGLVSFGYGTSKTVKANVRGSYQKDDVNIVFNAGVFGTDGPDAPYSTMSTQDLSWMTTNNTVEGIWGNSYKFFNVSTSFKEFYANVTYNFDKKGLDLFFPSAREGAVAKRTYSSFSFGYSKEFSKKFSLDGKFTYHKGSVQADWDWFTPPGELNLGGDNNFREDYELDLTGYFNPSEKFSLTAGLYYRKIIHEQLLSYAPPDLLDYRIGLLEPAESRAAYLQADVMPSDKLKFVVGVRVEQASAYSVYWRGFSPELYGADGDYDYDKWEFIPRFAAIWKLNDKNVLKFFYGKAINHPSVYQTGAQAISGLPSLEPEFIQTFELNYVAALSDKFTVNMSVFYNMLDSLIVNDPYIDPDTGAWIGENRNAGEMKTVGVELALLTKPFNNFVLELSGTYQKTEDQRDLFKDYDVGYSPKILAYLKAAYSISKNATIALTGRYVGEMEALYDPTIGGRIANTVDSYFILDANLRFDNLFGKGWYLGVRCSNLFDEEYLYPSFTLNGFWADLGLIGNGRLVLVTLGYKF